MNRRRFFLASCGILASTVLVGCDNAGPKIETRKDGTMFYKECRQVSDGYQMVYDPVGINVGAVNMGNGWKMKEQFHTECREIDVTATVAP